MAMPVSFQFCYGMTFLTALAVSVDTLGSLLAIMPQLLRVTIHSLLGRHDSIDCGNEIFLNVKGVMDDLVEGG